MGTGEEPPVRRENGRKRRRWMGGEDDDDEEYVAVEEEEEDFAEELAASSDGEEEEDSDAEYQEDEEEEEEEETPRPKRPAKGGARGRKGKMDPATARAKRRRYEVDDDYEEEPSEDEEPNEEDEGEEYDEEDTPRPVKGGARGQKGNMDPSTARAKRRRYEVDDDYEEEPSEDEAEEYHEEAPRPVKGGPCDQKGKMDPATARARRRRYEVDGDYEEEPSEDEEPNKEGEVEEYDEETPWPIKGGARGQKGKMDPAKARARRRRYEVDDDYEEPDEDEEEPDMDEEVEEYHEEIEEEEEAPPRPKSVAKCVRRGQNVEVARSHRRKYEEDDMDFEPELDDDEEEVDEDIDFDPEVDDEDEFEDEEEVEFGAARARKVAVKNSAKQKSVSKRRSLKKKKANKGSKAYKRKIRSSTAKKSAPVRRVRKRFVVDDSDEDSEDDDDFIVHDQVEVNRHPRKKARAGTSKRTELECTSAVEEGIWPNVESDTSEFEFVTSDDEPDDAGTAVVEASTVRKGRKKRKSGSASSSDSEFIVSDKELENLGETESLNLPVPPTPIRKNSTTCRGQEKGKEKEEPEEAGKPICGICLSEEQRATVQGVLNCCSHYFCFACIMEWSRVESRCPLCKQRFTTITKSSKEDLGLGLRKSIIKVEERDQVYQPTEEEIRRWLDPYENVVCIECNQGGDDSLMLLCDICDSSAHTYCVGLGSEVPEGNWYCGGCRLSDEGPSHTRIPHTVGYERQSYRNHVDFSYVGFGVAAQNGTYDRSSSINRRRSFRSIDLNLSPREVPGETHPVESQASTDNVSTPGRRATVSGRRQIHRYIRILLSRPRPITTTGLEDMLPSFVPHNGAVPRTEQNHRSFRSSSEANTSQIPDGIQNQHNGLQFAPYIPLDGDDFQHIEGVKSNLNNL